MGDEEEIITPTERHIFVSALDSYTGRNLVELFTGQVQVVVPEEEEEQEEEDNDNAQDEKKSSVIMHGVLRDPASNLPADSSRTVALTKAQSSDRDMLLEILEACDTIIYDITTGGQEILEEATWAVETLHDRLELWPKRKVFILISTVMTWAKTKPVDPDDPDAQFTEDDYRRRRAHPHFQDHLTCEKTVFSFGKTNKKKFKTYVIAAGATFGKGEDVFHMWMKQAWHNEKELVVYGRGNNVIPTIHVLDLAQLVQYTFENMPGSRYMLAVDGVSNTQRQIVKAISVELSTGQVRKADKEDVIATDLPLLHADLVVTDLKMEGIVFADNIEERRSEGGMVEGIREVVKEYRAERKLQPMRVCVLGPPLSGKSFLAAKIAERYKLHHLRIGEVIEKAIQDLKDIARPPMPEPTPVTIPEESEETTEEANENEDEMDGMDELEDEIEEEEEDEDEMDEEKRTPEEAEELLQEIEEQRTTNKNGRLDDAMVLQLVQERIRSKPCQNQGFVLDGYPKLTDQAEALFGGEAGEPDEPQFNKATMPELVVALDAPDEFLCERAMGLPEEVVQGTHWTEDGVLRRLEEYRNNNKEDVTVLNFFDELEVHPLLVDVSQDTSDGLEDTCKLVVKKLGAPRNYGLSKEEAEELRAREEQQRAEEEERRRAEAERCEQEEREQRRREQLVWMERMTEVKRQELEALEARSLPLRNYLMKHVIPTLTEGLLECAKTKPDDPVDFLAEFLFTNNPQTNLVEWETLQKSKLEEKEAGHKRMIELWAEAEQKELDARREEATKGRQGETAENGGSIGETAGEATLTTDGSTT